MGECENIYLENLLRGVDTRDVRRVYEKSVNMNNIVDGQGKGKENSSTSTKHIFRVCISEVWK